jgi:tetratricopeptide (TPR) repeat protein
MTTGTATMSRAKRLIRASALPIVLLLGVGACSAGNDTSSNDPPAKVVPDAKRAAKALNTGLEAHAAGKLTAATAAYNTTLKYDAKNKYAFYNLALIDEANGNYGLAEGNYRSAIKVDPAYEPALFNLAILRTARDDPKEAISLYQRAVKADKKDAAAWLNLGLLLRDNGEKRAGDKDVLRALALDPKLKDPATAAAVAGLGTP